MKKKKPRTHQQANKGKATAKTKSQSGRGTKVPGSKLLYNGTNR